MRQIRRNVTKLLIARRSIAVLRTKMPTLNSGKQKRTRINQMMFMVSSTKRTSSKCNCRTKRKGTTRRRNSSSNSESIITQPTAILTRYRAPSTIMKAIGSMCLILRIWRWNCLWKHSKKKLSRSGTRWRLWISSKLKITGRTSPTASRSWSNIWTRCRSS